MANGNGPVPGPAWLQPVVQLTTQVGVPTVVAGVLLWFVLFKMGGTLDMIQHEEADRTRIVKAMQESFLASQKEQTDAFDKSIKANIDANKIMADRFVDALKDISRKNP